MTLSILSLLARPLVANLRRLLADDGGVAVTEFAVVAPTFLTLGILGLDTTNYVIAHMRVSQIALQVADNASRVGELDVLVARKVYESDVNDVMVGAVQYAGSMDIAAHGRIILSSLERNREGGQWIHWQRCFGDKDYDSTQGHQGDGITGTAFPGMGRAGARITASPGDAVMFVEVAYDYQSFSPFSIFDGAEIVYTGSFNVRDSRDLTQIYQTTPASDVASCTQASNPIG